MSVLALAHVITALVGLILGLGVLANPKGTQRHRRLGRTFVAAMLIANGAALLSYEDGRFSIFHGLALVSLGCMAAGLRALRRRGTLAGCIDHATWMSWTFAGLLAAGAGQTAALMGVPSIPVILAVVAVAYWLLSILRLPSRVARRVGPRGVPVSSSDSDVSDPV